MTERKKRDPHATSHLRVLLTRLSELTLHLLPTSCQRNASKRFLTDSD